MIAENLLVWILSLINFGMIGIAGLFTYESVREQEIRASKIGWGLIALHLLLGVLILAAPTIRIFLAFLFSILLLLLIIFIIPFKKEARSLRGAAGYLANTADYYPMDEREIMFARNRGLKPGTEQYNHYYAKHPQHKAYDDKRRSRGGPLGKPGSIDGSYRPNVAMLVSSFELPNVVGPKARVDANPGESGSTYAEKGRIPPAEINPEKATKIVKGWAKHLGADLVGICKIDPRWAYSHKGEIHYGEWEEWGEKTPEPLPYAVVVATEMEHDMVMTAPHTPSVVESGANYSKGAYITTILANWFGNMGYRAVAEHNRHYELVLVPLAVDAGLGELGRQGYLIADKFGPRVRLFAVQTDMPLVPDRPIDLGAEEFCRTCVKCAESCPSKSIPRERQQKMDRGIKRWKTDEESCFDYWGKVGTDCCVCMAICPFSRPYRSIHKWVRLVLKRSRAARVLFPYIDNFIYGRRWKPRKAPGWMAYPKRAGSKPEPASKPGPQ